MEQLRCILTVIAFFVSTSSLAQKYFGISGGLASNMVVGSEVDFQKKIHNNVMSPRIGPAFSVFLKKEIHPYLYLKYEAAYIRKGNSSSDNALWNLNLEYVSIPLKIAYQPVNFYNLKKNLQVGIEGGVSFNYEAGDGTNNISKAYSSSTQARVNKFAVSALFGANIEYRLVSRRALFFNTTWYHDVTPLLSYESGNANYKLGNQGWIFTAGLLFPLR